MAALHSIPGATTRHNTSTYIYKIIPAAISARRIRVKTREDCWHAPDSDSRIPLGKSRRMDPQTQLRHMHVCVHACCATSATFCDPAAPTRPPAPENTCSPLLKRRTSATFIFTRAGHPIFRWKMGGNGWACVCVCVQGHSNFPLRDPRVAARLRLDTGGVLGYFFPPFLINFWGVGPNFLSECCVPLFIFHSSSNSSQNLVASTKRGAIESILILFTFKWKKDNYIYDWKS